MKHIDTWKTRLKAAKSELKFRQRQYNSAVRHLNRILKFINETEKKIDYHMAKSKQQFKPQNRRRSL